MSFWHLLAVQNLSRFGAKKIAALHSEFIHEVAERSPHHKLRLMTIAERLKQEGHHNGLQQGLQQGIQQGLAQGVQKGTQEEALRIARMMLENGIDRDLVRLITGLLPDYVTE
ncbi:hypothetical protein [Citrobacter freundii]|uniref:hypothetical protein n=2 Tax=Citrobacter TaxID=544 RepID=UPI001FFE0E01|nr:hypothetical protein [Citrobacter freundii]